MKCEYFTFKWCLTLYSCFLPCEMVVKIFDLFMIEGWDAIYKVGISLLLNLLANKML